MTNKVKQLFKFLSLLRVEVLMFVLTFSFYFKRTPLEVLIQDKLCRNDYNLSEEFCFRLPYVTQNDSDYHFKDKILSQAVKYKMYQSIINNLPTFFWPMFLGAWIDKYVMARKIIFVIGAITHCMEAAINFFNCYYFESDVNWILISFVPNIFIGSMVAGTAYSYVAVTTPNHLKTIRMTIYDTLDALAHLVGVIAYGKLINQSPVWSEAQVHNYGLIFFISSLSAFIACVWTVFFINQEQDTELFVEYFGDKTNRNNDLDENDQKTEQDFQLGHIFNCDNVREVMATCFKRRDNYGRTQIWLVIGSVFVYLFVLMAVPAFEFQFYQKIYNWDAKDMSFWESIGLVANSVFVLTFTPILIRVFGANDSVLSVIGFTGLMLRMIALAAVLSPIGYYLSIGFSCTTWMASIGLRTHLSKVVSTAESGKIFTLLTVMDGIAPTLAATAGANTFEMTINTAPQLSFVCLAVICFIAIIMSSIILFLNKNQVKDNKSEQECAQ